MTSCNLAKPAAPHPTGLPESDHVRPVTFQGLLPALHHIDRRETGAKNPGNFPAQIWAIRKETLLGGASCRKRCALQSIRDSGEHTRRLARRRLTT